MSNDYDCCNTEILVRPSAETAVKISVFAKMRGFTRASAAKMLLEEHPLLEDISLDDEGKAQVADIINRNIAKRKAKKLREAEMRSLRADSSRASAE